MIMMIMMITKEVFNKELRKPKCPKEPGPLEMFFKRHIRHPEMEYLLTAIGQCDDYHVERLMRHIGSDGRR